MDGSIPSVVLGLIAFFSTYLLFCLTNSSTVSISQKEVLMKKHSIVPMCMFVNSVAINLFSANLGVAGQT